MTIYYAAFRNRRSVARPIVMEDKEVSSITLAAENGHLEAVKKLLDCDGYYSLADSAARGLVRDAWI